MGRSKRTVVVAVSVATVAVSLMAGGPASAKQLGTITSFTCQLGLNTTAVGGPYNENTFTVTWNSPDPIVAAQVHFTPVGGISTTMTADGAVTKAERAKNSKTWVVDYLPPMYVPSVTVNLVYQQPNGTQTTVSQSVQCPVPA